MENELAGSQEWHKSPSGEKTPLEDLEAFVGRRSDKISNVQDNLEKVVGKWEHRLNDLLKEANALLVRQNKELEALSERLKFEVEQIKEIQENLLPEHPPQKEDIEFAAQYLPSAELSGDYYDFIGINKELTGILVADVSGHGAASAVVMAITRVLTHMHLTQISSAGTALTALNSLMSRFIPTDQFVTAVYGIYNHITHTLFYSTAGHPPPIHYSARSKSLSLLQVKPRFPLRLFTDVEYETLHVDLAPEDAVIFYTDGLTELEDRQRQILSEDQLLDWIAEIVPESASRILWHILERASDFTHGAPPHDDLTIVILKRKPLP